MSGIKKFFQSIDLRNNKILNGKVETPTQNQHIANKEFVEEFQNYDTTKANTYNNPFKFDWITNIYNKTFKQILDDLFFPRVLPTFTNPVVELFSFKLFDYPNQFDGKYIVFNNQPITFNLTVRITNNDRLPLDMPLLKVYNDITIQTYSPTRIEGDLFEYENIIFKFNKETAQFKIVNNFDVALAKPDSYGDTYLKPGFEIPYILDEDVVANDVNLFNHISIRESLMFRNQTIENLPDSLYTDIILDGPVPVDFSFTKNIYFNEGMQGLFDILIPTDFLPTDFLLFADIYDNSGATPKLIKRIDLNEILIQDWDLTLIADWYTEYMYYQLNLGYFSTDIMAVIKIHEINYSKIV